MPAIHLPAARHRAQPWKNGLGVSQMIAEHPDGASYEKVFWQVGGTAIATDCPFSSLPQLDRQFMVLEGGGVELTSVDDVGKTHKKRLKAMRLPYAFRGDWKTECKLIKGPVRVFNVMVRRGLYVAHVDFQGEKILAGAGGETLIAVELKSLDAWMLDGEGTIELPPSAGKVAAVRIRALPKKR
ncbi:MAG: HutD/Ves family protein [Burkholderiales bacterium]